MTVRPSRDRLAVGALVGVLLGVSTPSPICAQGFAMPDPPAVPQRTMPRKARKPREASVEPDFALRLGTDAGRAATPKRPDTEANIPVPAPGHDDLGVPQLDAARWCAQIAGKLTTATCLLTEQQQAEYARIFWDSLAEAGKRHCLERLRRLGPNAATYQSLAACVRTQLAREESGTR